MKLAQRIPPLFTKKCFDKQNLLSIYCISDEEMKNILLKKENSILFLDFDLDQIKF